MIRARLLVAALALTFSAGPTFAQDAKLEAQKAEAVKGVDEMAKLAQEMVDSVFSFGELGFQEVETSRYLTAQLEKFGFKVQRGFGRDSDRVGSDVGFGQTGDCSGV